MLNNADPNVACEISFKLDKKEGANGPPYYGRSIFEQITEWGLCKCTDNNDAMHILSQALISTRIFTKTKNHGETPLNFG